MSFETTVLRRLAARTRLPIVQLLDADGRDLPLGPHAYATWHARGWPGRRVRRRHRPAQGPRAAPRRRRRRRRAVGAGPRRPPGGLTVHVWTLRAENRFLPTNLRVGDDPDAHGDMAGEVAACSTRGSTASSPTTRRSPLRAVREVATAGCRRTRHLTFTAVLAAPPSAIGLARGMTSRKTTLAAAVALAAAATTLLVPSAAQAGPRTDLAADPVVIGHRGASGYRPEHTLAAYELAIRQGADYIEPDLVSTQDGVLVARHENEISGTTDVADHPEFADRRTTKTIDGRPVTGWFTEDFTCRELRTLRAVERLPEVRPDNTAYDGEFRIPTLDEVLKLARRRAASASTRRPSTPPTSTPSASRWRSRWSPPWPGARWTTPTTRSSSSPSRSPTCASSTPWSTWTLAQLVDAAGGPADLPGRRTPRWSPRRACATIATYADGVGAAKNWVLPRDASGSTGAPSSVVDDAHAAGLVVHVWTLRRENQFMATNFRVGTDPNAPGDLYAEARAFLDAGVDGLFSDNPDLARAGPRGLARRAP